MMRSGQERCSVVEASRLLELEHTTVAGWGPGEAVRPTPTLGVFGRTATPRLAAWAAERSLGRSATRQEPSRTAECSLPPARNSFQRPVPGPPRSTRAGA